MGLGTVELGPFRVRVWSRGTPTVDAATPLVFLHGLESHPGDVAFLRSLAERRPVVAPELPGYGASTGFEHIEELLDLVLFERRLIEHLGVGPVHVMGHSLGGMLAAEVAALCPHLVRKLVLVDAYGLWIDEEPLPDPYVLGPTELAAAKWHDPAAAPDPEPAIAEADPDDPHASMFTRSRNLATSTKFLWPLPDRGLRKRLPYVVAPSLVVHGRHDGLVPLRYGEELAAAIPDARLVVVDGAGHFPMIERQDAFVAAVEAFLAG